MNPKFPCKKASLLNRKGHEQFLMYKSINKCNQQPKNSMNFLQIRGKDRQQDLSLLKQKSSKKKEFECVQEFMSNCIADLKYKISQYCIRGNSKFVQHEQIQKAIKEKGQWITSIVNEEDLFRVLIHKLNAFLNETGSESMGAQSPQKLQHSSSIQNQIQKETIDFVSASKKLNKINRIQTFDIDIKGKNQPEHSIFHKVCASSPQIEPDFSPNQQIHLHDSISKIPIACSSTVSEILYKEARNRRFADFHTFCEKILLSKIPVICDFQFFKQQKLDKTNNFLKQICDKLSIINTKLEGIGLGEMRLAKKQYSFYKQAGQGQDLGQHINEICLSLKKLNQLHNLKSIIFDCARPCCQFQQKLSQPSTKSKMLLNLKQAAKKSIHYKTQATDQYFNRYYNKESFDKTRIVSLSKTKTQEMEQLEKTYYKNVQNKKACKKRSYSLMNNFEPRPS